jgi:hypothetical protein
MTGGDETVLAFMNLYGIYIIGAGEPEVKPSMFSIIFGSTPQTFVEKTRSALTQLRSRGNGKALLELICEQLKNNKQTITIELASRLSGQEGSGWDEKTNVLRFCPEVFKTAEDEDQLNDIPAFIILGHELIHAYHSLCGSSDYGEGYHGNKAIEEARTIGLGPWANDPLTENGLRKEWGLRPRVTFGGSLPTKFLKYTKFEKW